MEKIVGLGEILWDVFPDGAVLGGAVCNFIMHVNSLGMEGVVVSSIGSDDYGKQVKDIFEKRNVNLCVNELDYPTGTVIVKLDSEGKATYNFTNDSAWDYLTLTPEMMQLAKECNLVCFGTICQRSKVSRDSILSFLSQTKKSCIRIFDINIRGDFYSKETIQNSLKYATVLKLNDEELPLLMQMFNITGSEDEALKSIKELYDLDLVIFTKGADGSRLYRSETEDDTYIPGKVKVVDTVGAGDSFTAAVAVGLINGDSLKDINKKANTVAAYVCGQKGGTPELLL